MRTIMKYSLTSRSLDKSGLLGCCVRSDGLKPIGGAVADLTAPFSKQVPLYSANAAVDP